MIFKCLDNDVVIEYNKKKKKTKNFTLVVKVKLLKQ